MNSHYKQFFDLNGKTAVVTGGVGILGQRFCKGLAEFGAKVAVVDLDEKLCIESQRNRNAITVCSV